MHLKVVHIIIYIKFESVDEDFFIHQTGGRLSIGDSGNGNQYEGRNLIQKKYCTITFF